MIPLCISSAFVHRCGRTARCGAEGCALLFLAPNEVAYVNFLEINQKVQLTELSPYELDQMCAPASDTHLTPEAVTSRIRIFCKRDRLLYEKSVRAFVSYVQFYRKHECHLLLSLKDLNFGVLGNAFGLLRLPRMPELRDANTSAFNAPAVDLDKIKYREKSVAKQRELMKANEQLQPKFHKNSKPWSKAKEARQKKHDKRQKRSRKFTNATADQSKQSTDSHRPTIHDDTKDIEELNEDYRLLKRARKRKAAEAEFDCD
ncbi:DEAD box polypeptide 55 [Fasciola gigantica]|uniref:DEAD box polypeptide 55 n=1 Tax=Fasciola gigantica TaxID=46835 RepID=A0A504YUM0_FASGI|nr:DEAD box polypeptide 55 [Fasciola gigantica]